MGSLSLRWPVRALLASDAVVRRVPRGRLRVAARTLHSGVALGLARPEVLEALDEAVYASGRYAYHDTDAHNLRGLFDWEARALAQHFPATGRLMVTSAGGGREVVALRARGYDVEAFECNEQLRARANGLLRRTGESLTVAPVPRDRCPSFDADLDGAIVGWGAYTFLRGAHRRRPFLRELAAGLRPGAPALLSFFVRRGDPRRFRWIARMGNAVGWLRGAEAVEIGDVMDPGWQHYLSREELIEDVRASGLVLTAFSTEGYGHAIVRRPHRT